MGISRIGRLLPPIRARIHCTFSSLDRRHRKEQPDSIHWTEEIDAEYDYLRCSLSDKTLLHTFQPELEIILHRDASERGIGGVLLQKNAQGEEVPIAFYSKKLLLRQVHYTISEKECLTMVEAMRHFEAYLLGAHLTIVTDHKALLALPRTTS